ncbi:MAG TPA: hypothetical protein VJO35_09860 [Terriglobales bacterium]|nr:hypothetical protein [Terriglobales bacterium]
MRARNLFFVFLLFAAGISLAAPKSQTFTGEVSDAMCGAKHMMSSKADCTRACVAKGSSYALVVGDKAYTLHTTNKAALDELNTLAGEQAKVTGTADGDTIEVSKVTAAK